jgi:hypothetical protein
LVACKEGDIEKIKIILEENPEIYKTKTHANFNCFHLAAFRNQIKVIDYMVGKLTLS